MNSIKLIGCGRLSGNCDYVRRIWEDYQIPPVKFNEADMIPRHSLSFWGFKQIPELDQIPLPSIILSLLYSYRVKTFSGVMSTSVNIHVDTYEIKYHSSPVKFISFIYHDPRYKREIEPMVMYNNGRV